MKICMSDIGPEKSTVTIRQKINPAQPQISHAEQAFQKSLHKALAQKALSLFGLKVKIQEHRIAKVPVSELAEITEQYVMLTLLENSGSEPGFVAFDDAALAGFVTVQTLGCVLPNLTKGRTATLTDAALIAPFIEEALGSMQQSPDFCDDISHRKKYRFAQMITDTHRLLLCLQSEDFIFYFMTITMGADQHQAKILMAFPAIEKKSSKEENPSEQERSGRSHEAFLALPAEMQAELHRFRFPWSELSQLEVGAHLILPDDVLNNIKLRALNSSDTISAKLGRLSQFRAVQVDIETESSARNDGETSSDPNRSKDQVGEALTAETEISQGVTPVDLLQIESPERTNSVEKAPTDPAPA